MTLRFSILVAIIFLAAYLMLDPGNRPSNPDRSLMAYLQCSDLVAARLHTANPDAVPHYRSQRTQNAVYSVTSSVDVDPDPDKERRVGYQCRIRWSGRNETLPSSWQLLDLQLRGLPLAPSAPAAGVSQSSQSS